MDNKKRIATNKTKEKNEPAVVAVGVGHSEDPVIHTFAEKECGSLTEETKEKKPGKFYWRDRAMIPPKVGYSIHDITCYASPQVKLREDGEEAVSSGGNIGRYDAVAIDIRDDGGTSNLQFHPFSNEEESNFLHHFGWQSEEEGENGEENGLTESEINSFYETYGERLP